jgi:hypothetical protein
MEKPHLKYTFKEILIIAFSWLLAIAVVYIVYLKITLFYHN